MGDKASGVHKEWHSRGYLPHFDRGGILQSLTFRLADSLPQSKQHLLGQRDEIKKSREVESCLDHGYGKCLLRNDHFAKLVEGSLMFHDGERYRLLAWVLMPNHVHCVIEQFEGFMLGKIVATWKGYTSTMAKKEFGHKGSLWAEDYFDRFIRNADHFESVVRYIHENPVKARLADVATNWKWSSARYGIQWPKRDTFGPDGDY